MVLNNYHVFAWLGAPQGGWDDFKKDIVYKDEAIAYLDELIANHEARAGHVFDDNDNRVVYTVPALKY